ncbi:cytochrome P450 1B1 [Hemiscyllium ocellatum]|uniref:cytochrome P450 1B1 n=1 Tax=Hemiscyllium ocellatum TaxID=170820 RepID=UPI002967388D|nr:cytochrome P450 1B1 [Hemiscyllium ocellatum]
MIANQTCAFGQGLPASPSVQWILAAALSALLGLQACRWLQHHLQQCQPGSPPGPFPWPLIGNAAQLGRAPHLTFCRLAERYGSVFRLKLGSRAVVVLNGEESIRQALVRQGADFSGRPDFGSFAVVSRGRSLAFGPHSDLWRLHRKVAHSTMRAFCTSNLQTKRVFERHVVCETQQLVSVFMARGRLEPYFDPWPNLVVAVANVMCAACFGRRYEHSDQEFTALLSKNHRFGQTVGAGSLVDIMPWLQYFPNPVRSVYRDFKQLNQDFYLFVQDKARQHRQDFRPDRLRDMTDAFIRTIEHGGVTSGAGLTLSPDYVDSTVSDIFGASQDTLSTALHWITLYLVWRPQLQARIHQELDRVVGRQRIPSLEDQPRLPYLMAFLSEALRFSSFVSLTIPHATTRHTLLSGYRIAKGTVIFVNQWSVNHDPRKWPQPEVFDPCRFLTEAGTFNKDLASQVMIFSLGRRRCIGDELAKMLLFLSVSLLMHQCTFRANPKEQLTLDFTYGLTLKPKPFTINVTLRDTLEPLNVAVQRIQEANSNQ